MLETLCDVDVTAALSPSQGIEPKEKRAKEWRLLLRTWHPDKNPDKLEAPLPLSLCLRHSRDILPSCPLARMYAHVLMVW